MEATNPVPVQSRAETFKAFCARPQARVSDRHRRWRPDLRAAWECSIIEEPDAIGIAAKRPIARWRPNVHITPHYQNCDASTSASASSGPALAQCRMTWIGRSRPWLQVATRMSASAVSSSKAASLQTATRARCCSCPQTWRYRLPIPRASSQFATGIVPGASDQSSGLRKARFCGR